jgi:hypothetical protein
MTWPPKPCRSAASGNKPQRHRHFQQQPLVDGPGATSTGTSGQYLKIDLIADSGGYNPIILLASPTPTFARKRLGHCPNGARHFRADGMFAGSGWMPVRDIDPLTNLDPSMPTFNSVTEHRHQ